MRLLAAAAIMLAVAALAPPLAAQQVNLTRTSNDDTRRALAGSSRASSLAPTTDALPGLPAAAGTQSALVVSPPAGQHSVQLALLADSLYARTGSASFSKLQLIQPARSGSPAVFGPLKIALADGATAEVEFILLPSSTVHRTVRMVAAGFMQGEIDVGGSKLLFGVADANLNGRYGDIVTLPTSGRPTSDMLALDANNDGQLGGHAGASALPAFQPLGKLIRAGDAWYQLDVAPDGSIATLTKSQVETGRITVDAAASAGAGGSETALILISPNGMFTYKAGSAASLPAGQYQVMRAGLTRKDDAGRIWMLSGSVPPGPQAVVTVEPGKDNLLPIGSNMQLRVKANVDAARQLVLTPQVTDQFGTVYAPGAFRDGEMRPAPALKIFDSSGKMLKADSFSYG